MTHSGILTDTELFSECVRRYDALVSPYMSDLPKFNNMMKSSSSVISGSAALKFSHPDMLLSEQNDRLKDLDIYVKRSSSAQVINHLRHTQGFMFSNEIIVSSKPDDTSYPESHYSRFHFKTGIDRIIFLTKGDLRIDVIIAASNNSSIFPIIFFHSTIVMNLLTPTMFASLYGPLTKVKFGIVSPISMVYPQDFENWGNRALKPRAKAAINKYIDRGFTICELLTDTNLPGSVSLPMFRATNDSQTFKLKFSASNTYEYPDPLFPVVTWTLGGIPCGKPIDFDDFVHFDAHVSQ